MAFYCYQCGKEVSLPPSNRPGRTESCSHCSYDLHVCRNCIHYDTNAYNQCHEPSAERVVDKQKSNFCDYFKFREGDVTAVSTQSKSDRLKKLDDLFKK